MDSVEDMMKSVKEADAVVIVTNHKQYDYKAIIEAAKFVFDSRNATGKLGRRTKRLKDFNHVCVFINFGGIMAHYLVTGAAGFIGARTSPCSLNRDILSLALTM
jgi:hypothetical protein